LGIGDWANPQSPIPNPQSKHNYFLKENKYLITYLIKPNLLRQIKILKNLLIK